jgi:hypothetical protein
MKDLRGRFIENDPATLQWSSEPVSTEEKERAEELFMWISKN